MHTRKRRRERECEREREEKNAKPLPLYLRLRRTVLAIREAKKSKGERGKERENKKIPHPTKHQVWRETKEVSLFSIWISSHLYYSLCRCIFFYEGEKYYNALWWGEEAEREWERDGENILWLLIFYLLIVSPSFHIKYFFVEWSYCIANVLRTIISVIIVLRKLDDRKSGRRRLVCYVVYQQTFW